MNIQSIKNRADELLTDCKPSFIRIIIMLFLIGSIPSLFPIDSASAFIKLISIVLTIIFLPFAHGYIVSSLKIVRNQSNSLNDDDAFVGFKRFNELFSTYFLMGIIEAVVLFLFVFLLSFFLISMLSFMVPGIAHSMTEMALSPSSASSALLFLIGISPAIILGVLVALLVLAVIFVVLSTYLFAVPYLLEQYGFKGMNCIKESFAFIKGHFWDLIKLKLSFFGWMVLSWIIAGLAGALLGFIPILGYVAAAVIAGLFEIYTYRPKYLLSQAIFFEEIAYYRYGENKYTDVKEDQFD